MHFLKRSVQLAHHKHGVELVDAAARARARVHDAQVCHHEAEALEVDFEHRVAAPAAEHDVGVEDEHHGHRHGVPLQRRLDLVELCTRLYAALKTVVEWDERRPFWLDGRPSSPAAQSHQHQLRACAADMSASCE